MNTPVDGIHTGLVAYMHVSEGTEAIHGSIASEWPLIGLLIKKGKDLGLS